MRAACLLLLIAGLGIAAEPVVDRDALQVALAAADAPPAVSAALAAPSPTAAGRYASAVIEHQGLVWAVATAQRRQSANEHTAAALDDAARTQSLARARFALLVHAAEARWPDRGLSDAALQQDLADHGAAGRQLRGTFGPGLQHVVELGARGAVAVAWVPAEQRSVRLAEVSDAEAAGDAYVAAMLGSAQRHLDEGQWEQAFHRYERAASLAALPRAARFGRLRALVAMGWSGAASAGAGDLLTEYADSLTDSERSQLAAAALMAPNPELRSALGLEPEPEPEDTPARGE